jgi:hypothetical protein
MLLQGDMQQRWHRQLLNGLTGGQLFAILGMNTTADFEQLDDIFRAHD